MSVCRMTKDEVEKVRDRNSLAKREGLLDSLKKDIEFSDFGQTKIKFTIETDFECKKEEKALVA